MRVLPCGTTGLLLELADLEQVLGLHAALTEHPPAGVTDIVPAARTVLLVIDPAATDVQRVEQAVRHLQAQPGRRPDAELVEVPVTYDGEDLPDVAAALGCDVPELVRRHTSEEWTVAFYGFAPGFGYLAAPGDQWDDVPRRPSPRTKVPAGAVALAGGFSAIYPGQSPGGWQLIGRTELVVFDVHRDPPALLHPGVHIRFTDVGAR
jgi:KipI family sensor histidine kinase inhibitor